jgi:cell division septation protein DedD
MMKYLTYSLAFSMFFLSFSLSGQQVEISMDHPDRVNAGEDFTVTVTIKKGSLTDYSRFSQDIPQGLTASNVSSPNADFSFDEQRVRIIWLKMPRANEVSVSYQIAVDPRLKGSFTLGGVFAYVVDDERKFLNFDQNRKITIIPSSTIDPANMVDISDYKGGEVAVPAASPAGTGFAMAIREKPQLQENGSYLVRLLINNPIGSKYAKVEETIPSGYLVEEVSSNDGIVSHAASTVKFIWMTLPKQPEFELVYRLVPKQNEPQGNMLIEGLFTYTAGNENKVTEVIQMDVSLANLSQDQKRALLEKGSAPAPSSRTTPEVSNRTTTTVQRESRPPVSSSEVSTGSNRVIANTKVLDPGTGTYYRVQLSANLNAFDANALYRQLGVDREVFVEQHQGFYKYTVGPFQTYEQALSYKDRVDAYPEVVGAFVVGYRNGKRVSAGTIR